jgi:Domain of unknown function (DUF4864)
MNRTAKLLLLAGLFAICGTGAILQNHAERRRQAVSPNVLYAVVWKQIAAFREDDYASAYRQVSANFQEKFNIEAFSDLARTEYPGLRRARRVEFGALRFEGRRAIIPAYLFMDDGDIIPCIYSLVNEDDVWKIDGARVLRRWPAGRRLGGMRS